MIISFLRAYIIFFLLFAGVADLGYAQAGPELGAGNTAPQTSETNRPLIITPAFHYGCF
jgi:hypothetical protein